MSNCMWCGEVMEVVDGELSCPNECQDDCPTCDGPIGDCHEDGVCVHDS